MPKTDVAATVGSLFGYVLVILLWALAFKLDVEFWTNQFGHYKHVSIWVALLAGTILPSKFMYTFTACTLLFYLLA